MELDLINAELQVLADEEQDLVVEAAYSEYVQAMMAECYVYDNDYDDGSEY
jgi:hypothetical protein